MQDRIKSIRKDAGLTQQEFADKLNVSKNNIVNYENGRRSPTAAVIQLICREFNIDSHWLETGEGEPYAPQTINQQIGAFINDVMSEKDSAFRKRLIHSLSNMDADGWDILEKFLDDVMEGRE